MGALDEGHYNVELENGVDLGGVVIEGEPETLVIENAVKILLQELGEDINRDGLIKTPFRVAKAFRDGTRGYKQKVKEIVQGALFPEVGLESGVGHAGGVGGLVLVRDIDLFSYCESCLLPFQVKCHVGYVPSGRRVVGLSKLSRVAEVFGKRLQDPQRLADNICLALQEGIKPMGVAVLLQCSHIHFPNLEPALLDSNDQRWVKELVRSGSGIFENEKASMWVDFLGLLRFRGINSEDMQSRNCVDLSWCPSRSISKVGGVSSRVTMAVESIIQALGEDPMRKGLVSTPAHYVKWLMNFKNSKLEMNLNLNGFPRRGMGPSKSNGSANTHGEEKICSELNFTLWSLCEHHLLPFYGVVHIGHFSGADVTPVDRSLIQSVVHFYGFKLQVQERLTRQIAETVSSFLGQDIMVVVEAHHTCMISRGIEKFGSNTATIAVLGRFSNDPTARTEFLQSIPSYSTAQG